MDTYKAMINLITKKCFVKYHCCFTGYWICILFPWWFVAVMMFTFLFDIDTFRESTNYNQLGVSKMLVRLVGWSSFVGFPLLLMWGIPALFCCDSVRTIQVV